MNPYFLKLRHERETGFSLTELLVVVFIMGVVAAITVPSFLLQRKNAIDSQVKSDISDATNIIEGWIIRHPSQRVPSGTIEASPTGGLAIIDTSLTNNGLKGFKIHTGTTLVVEGNITPLGTFKITATNDRGNRSAGTGMVFDSAKGGYQ